MLYELVKYIVRLLAVGGAVLTVAWIYVKFHIGD